MGLIFGTSHLLIKRIPEFGLICREANFLEIDKLVPIYRFWNNFWMREATLRNGKAKNWRDGEEMKKRIKRGSIERKRGADEIERIGN